MVEFVVSMITPTEVSKIIALVISGKFGSWEILLANHGLLCLIQLDKI